VRGAGGGGREGDDVGDDDVPGPGLACPRPHAPATIQLAHGGGGRAAHELVASTFLRAFAPPGAPAPHDSAVVTVGGERIAFTTDAFVVSPRFFPGGDIGRLAICGTINDLAMAGAAPVGLGAAFVLEEGLPLDELERVVRSMRAAADACGVALVTGDTKVVDRGKGDGLYITTTGIGRVPPAVDLRPERVRPGDAVLVSGDVGRHGMAVLTAREGLAFDPPLASDCAPLAGLVAALLGAGADVRCLRDPTRGGLAAAVNEIASACRRRIVIDEASVPVDHAVAGACEVLGIDPFHVACEGRLVAFVAPDDAARALAALRSHPLGAGAARVGRVEAGPPGEVVAVTGFGSERLLDLPWGDPLPRIC
jgi:hydrogenase expression/formation protein HypE